MTEYTFFVEVVGNGETQQEAWEDAVRYALENPDEYFDVNVLPLNKQKIAEEQWHLCRKYLIQALGMRLNGDSAAKIGKFIGEKLKTIKPDPWTENDLDFGEGRLDEKSYNEMMGS